MAIKKWGKRLFLDGQLVTEWNIESYIRKTKEQLAALEEHRAVVMNGLKQEYMIRIETIGDKHYLVADDYCQEITKENVEKVYSEINAARTKLLTEGMVETDGNASGTVADDLEDYDNDYE